MSEAERTRRRVSGEDEEPARLHSPYTRIAIEWLLVALFAGVVFCILGVAAALVYWAWTA